MGQLNNKGAQDFSSIGKGRIEEQTQVNSLDEEQQPKQTHSYGNQQLFTLQENTQAEESDSSESSHGQMPKRTDSEDFIAVNIYEDAPKVASKFKKKEVRFTLDGQDSQVGD